MSCIVYNGSLVGIYRQGLFERRNSLVVLPSACAPETHRYAEKNGFPFAVNMPHVINVRCSLKVSKLQYASTASVLLSRSAELDCLVREIPDRIFTSIKPLNTKLV